MAESEKNMWGNLDYLDDIRTPTTYLKEQGNLLSEKTGGLLKGDVLNTSVRDADHTESELHIIVPTANNYRYGLLKVKYLIKGMYPLQITDYANDQKHECRDEEEFLSTLESVLSSKSVMEILGTLFSMSK